MGSHEVLVGLVGLVVEQGRGSLVEGWNRFRVVMHMLALVAEEMLNFLDMFIM